VIREDRELLAELAGLNRAMAPLALSILEGTASAAEQHNYARRLIAAGQQLQHRANETGGAIVEGEVLANGLTALPAHTAEPLSLGTGETTSVPASQGRPPKSPRATHSTRPSGGPR
jgi:hypothetical protein